MTYKGHLIFGTTCGILAKAIFDIENDFPVYLMSIAFGSLLPDIDCPQSFIGRITIPISWLIGYLFGHRGFTHTLLATIIIFVLTSDIGITIGYLSHLIGDSFTSRGIRFFYPLS